MAKASDKEKKVVSNKKKKEEEELEEVEEVEEVDEEEELDDYNSNEDSDYAAYSDQQSNSSEAEGEVTTKKHKQFSNEESSSESNYGFYLLVIIFLGIVVSIVPLYFYDVESPSDSGSSSSSSSSSSVCPLPPGQKLYTKAELAQYTAPPQILLAFLGVVYDVTSGGSYYQPPDGAYSFFAGKDGTRGFLTGEFTADQLVDDITDLPEGGDGGGVLSGLDTWVALYEEKYRRVGLLAGGAYYDQKGCPTEKQRWVEERMKKGKQAAKETANQEQEYPPCNSQWNAATKSGRVWCSTASGGVTRSWTGRPRQFYDLARKSWRCACLQADGEVPEEEWCEQEEQDGQNKKKSTVKREEKSTGVKYASGEVAGGGKGCLWKHYKGCPEHSLECPIAD